ncbi:C39 family peptidase, partial [Catellatospora bangladeshensis]
MTTRSKPRRALSGILSTLAVLAAVLLIGSPARAASSNYLSGPAYGETLVFYCGPTAVQIALARGGASSVPSQHTLALETDTYHNPLDPGMPSVQAAVPVLNERLNTNFYYYWPRDNATEAYGDFRKNLVHSIDMGYPVVVNIKVEPNDVRPPNYPVRTTSIYHYVTVVGYTDDGYTAIVADPAGQGGADGVLPDDWNNVAREWSWPSALLWDMLWTGYAAGIAPASMGEPEYDDYIPGGNTGGGGGGVNMPSPGSSNSATRTDFSGDGDADILARNAGTKDLHLYQGNGAGGFQTGAGGIAGNNWSAFDTVITAGDFSGDGAVDVIARHATSKDLYLYEGDGFGGFATGTGTLIGNNWAAFDMILAPGDFTGDGKVDLLARNATTKAL